MWDISLRWPRAPQFGPVFLELAQEYNGAIAVTVTNDLLAKRAEAYRTLFRLEEHQRLSRYYINKERADAQLRAAAKMRYAYAATAQAFGNINGQVKLYVTGIQFIIVLPTLAATRQVLFSIDTPAPTTDTGKISMGSQTLVNTVVGPLRLPLGEHVFYLQYIDIHGAKSDVFHKTFRVDPIAVIFLEEGRSHAACSGHRGGQQRYSSGRVSLRRAMRLPGYVPGWGSRPQPSRR